MTLKEVFRVENIIIMFIIIIIIKTLYNLFSLNFLPNCKVSYVGEAELFCQWQ